MTCVMVHFSFRFDRPKDYIFHFNLSQKGNEIQVSSERDRPVQSRAELIQFWNRIKRILKIKSRNNL